MTHHGAGDRWLAGLPVPGVAFAHHARVAVVRGPHDGRSGRVALLMLLGDDPLYLVTLDGGVGEVRLRQSALAPSA